MSGHVWGAASLVFSDTVWQQIAAEDRFAIEEVTGHWAEEQRRMVGEASEELRATLKERGMTENEVDKAPSPRPSNPSGRTRPTSMERS